MVFPPASYYVLLVSLHLRLIYSVWPTFVFALIEHIWNPCFKWNEISTVGNPSLASVVSDRKRVLLMSVNWSCMKDTLGTYDRFFWVYPLSTALSSPQALDLKFDLPRIVKTRQCKVQLSQNSSIFFFMHIASSWVSLSSQPISYSHFHESSPRLQHPWGTSERALSPQKLPSLQCSIRETNEQSNSSKNKLWKYEYKITPHCLNASFGGFQKIIIAWVIIKPLLLPTAIYHHKNSEIQAAMICYRTVRAFSYKCHHMKLQTAR